MSFQTTLNKDLVRNYWDFQIIKQWSDKLGTTLTYFGLPGPQIRDIVVWRDFIHSSTGVERVRKGKNQKEEDRQVRQSIDRYVSLHNIRGWQLLRGDVEDIILDGVSIDNTRPKHSSGIGNPLLSSMNYTLINLDFYGGIAYKNSKGESKRTRAIKKLFERQQYTDFLLLMTLQVRDTVEEEITNYLLGAQREAMNRKVDEHSTTLGWYADRADGEKKYKLKALVPIFIRREAERWGFDCYSYPVVAYIGTGNAVMVHFVFELVHRESILHAFSDQSENDLINIPLIEIAEDKLQVSPMQHPNYNFQDCQHLLKCLPETLCKEVLESLPTG